MKKLHPSRLLWKNMKSQKMEVARGRDADSVIFASGIRDPYCKYMLRAKADLYSWRHSVKHRAMCNSLFHRKLIFQLKKESKESLERRLQATYYDISNQ